MHMAIEKVVGMQRERGNQETKFIEGTYALRSCIFILRQTLRDK